MKISLDSNVFRDQEFIEWLILNSEKISIYLSIITCLETFYWYTLRNISKSNFKKDLKALQVQIVPLIQDDIYKISNNAKKSSLRFKHHARDFIIGTHAHLKETILVTQNLKHFEWMGPNQTITPDNFVIMFSSTGEQSH
ncbi:MAG: type II toxin-antitoxin system VapC family toxin [Promethearchaeota archaeon]